MKVITYKIHPKYPLLCMSNGRIVSMETGTEYAQQKRGAGYWHISFKHNRKTILKTCRRLIAESFFGESEMHVNHINGIKSDNDLSNLEFVSRKQNTRHAVAIGLIKSGDQSLCTKIKTEERIKIKELRKSGLSCIQIGKLFGITRQHVGDICNERDSRGSRERRTLLYFS